jgi:hypothetical protein
MKPSSVEQSVRSLQDVIPFSSASWILEVLDMAPQVLGLVVRVFLWWKEFRINEGSVI